jgi:hypothetical protein
MTNIVDISSLASNNKAHKDYAIKVKFQKLDLPVLVFDESCNNPECKCRNIYLKFFELDNEELGDYLFEIKLNVDTWEMESYKAFKNNINCFELATEFMNDFTEELKSLLKIRFENKFIIQEDRVQENIDYSELFKGNCVYYSDFFYSYEYNQFIFEHQGIPYFVMDIYCSNINCDCNDVVLAFLR